MLGIFADDHDPTLAFYHLAFLANPLYRRFHLHGVASFFFLNLSAAGQVAQCGT